MSVHGGLAVGGVVTDYTVVAIDESVSEDRMPGNVQVHSSGIKGFVDLTPGRYADKSSVVERNFLAAQPCR
jgi:hypothetical protein